MECQSTLFSIARDYCQGGDRAGWNSPTGRHPRSPSPRCRCQRHHSCAAGDRYQRRPPFLLKTLHFRPETRGRQSPLQIHVKYSHSLPNPPPRNSVNIPHALPINPPAMNPPLPTPYPDVLAPHRLTHNPAHAINPHPRSQGHSRDRLPFALHMQVPVSNAIHIYLRCIYIASGRCRSVGGLLNNNS